MIPRRRRVRRNSALSSALSATNAFGRVVGRLRLRGTRIVRTVGSASVRSCGCALSTCRPIGTSVPSATAITVEPSFCLRHRPLVRRNDATVEQRLRPRQRAVCIEVAHEGTPNALPSPVLRPLVPSSPSRCWVIRTPSGGLPRNSPCTARTVCHSVSGGCRCVDDLVYFVSWG